MIKSKIDKLIQEFSLDNLEDLLFEANLSLNRKDFSFYNKDELFGDIFSLGNIETSDNKKVIVVATKVKKDLSEKTSRKKQYDISKKILASSNSYSAGIFVFYDDSGNFRFSLVYADYSGTRRNWSTFRRFTYFVSSDEKITNKTFINQIGGGDFSTLNNIKEVFSVEKVTREFFKKYRDLFFETKEDFEQNKEFQNIVVNTNISTSADFVKKLMGQIVFLYFVQKKGWLGVPIDKDWGDGDQVFLRTLFTDCMKLGKNYFNDYLEPLFYEALAEKSDNDLFKISNSKVPFLNGGLFESVYQWEKTKINIPDKTIEKLLDFFDQYNFTVDENTPLDQEISVDPEMLGKIFENLLDIKDRKDKGAFYTPREIVHYMCRESLIQHIVSDTSIPEENIRKLFDIKDTDLSVVVEDEKKSQNIKEVKERAEKIDTSLRDVKVVDPAVGSGAFPMGMLNEISTTRFYLNTNFLHKKNERGKELSLYDIKKETLENCIHAVDIDPGAVEIAKLRFWLALIVEYESNNLNIAPPTLPNLDYKIMQGNSLLEEYEGVKLFDENIIKITDTGKEKQIEDLKKRQSVIQKEYLDLNKKNELTPIKKSELEVEAKKIYDLLKKLNKVEKEGVEKIGLFDSNTHKESKLKSDELKSLQKQFFETNNKDRKIAIRKKIGELEWDLIEATLREQGKISELDKLKSLKNQKTKPFFLWKLHFSEVFEEKGGFDIVIGNPPYVSAVTMARSISQKKQYKALYPLATGSYDLYVLFLFKALELTNSKGSYAWIIPNKFLIADYAKKCKELLIGNGGLINSIDVSSFKVFKETGVYPVIIIGKKGFKRDYKDLTIDTYEDLGQQIFKEVGKLKQHKTFKDFGIKLYAGTTGFQAYQIVPFIKSEKMPDSIPFVVSGGVDRYHWSNRDTRYMGKKYNTAFINKNSFIADSKWNFWNNEKIIIAGMTKVIEAVYSPESVALGVGIYGIYDFAGFEPKCINGLLNSKYITYYFRQRFKDKHLAGGYLGINKSTIEDLPLVEIEKVDQLKISRIVDQILTLKKQNKDADTKNLEAKIDQLVYKLYDLTPEEIEIVENSTKK